jgi:hypothetical protein
MARRSIPGPRGAQPLSWAWVGASIFLFIAAELILGVLVGKLVVGRYVSISLRFMLQGMLNLSAYFAGGFVIGLVSPGIRILEPAIGAAACVAIMLGVTLFTPYSFLAFSTGKLLIGGGIAFLLAMAGARLGEKVAGNRI